MMGVYIQIFKKRALFICQQLCQNEPILTIFGFENRSFIHRT